MMQLRFDVNNLLLNFESIISYFDNQNFHAKFQGIRHT